MYHKAYQMTAALALSIVLVASGLIVGLAPTSYAQGVLATRHIEQGEDEETIIGSIELTMRTMTIDADGDIVVTVMQDGSEIDSDSIDVDDISWMSYNDYSVEFSPALNVTGPFDIIVEHFGSGRILMSSSIDISSETTTAGDNDDDTGSGGNDDETGGDGDGSNNDSEESDAELEEILANKVAERNIDDDMEVESVEFTARKMTLSTNGDLVIAIVKDDTLVAAVEISTDELSQISYSALTAEFGEPVEVEGDFDVILAHLGGGRILGNNIAVVGTTETSGGDGDGDNGNNDSENPPAEGTAVLTVDAVDQNGNKLAGLWVALMNGGSELVEQGFTEDDATFTLNASKTYMVEVGDFFDESNNVSYDFVEWLDSVNDDPRRTVNPAEFENGQDTFNALYTVTTGSAAPLPDSPPADDTPTEDPPVDDPPTDPTGAPGTITVFAHRIPSEHWGPTFKGAGDMWFVLYNSTGWLVTSDFYNEDGTTVSGLNEGATYFVYATNCDECHGSTHDVIFEHWQDSTTENPRAVTTGQSVHAYYAYDPDL